jgi:hypothetical protein
LFFCYGGRLFFVNRNRAFVCLFVCVCLCLLVLIQSIPSQRITIWMSGVLLPAVAGKQD